MVQVGMNERTKKTPCKPENVLGKIPFYRNQNQIGFQPIDKPKEQHKKSGTATTELVNLK
jgi:hypothetical protein